MQRVIRVALLTVLSVVLLACVNLATYNYEEGISCFRGGNYRKAFILLMPEAQKGRIDAQYAIGYMYYYGHGVMENRKKAWFWIRQAAAKGYPEAVEAVKILSTTDTITPV